jgi:hypothetical protein
LDPRLLLSCIISSCHSSLSRGTTAGRGAWRRESTTHTGTRQSWRQLSRKGVNEFFRCTGRYMKSRRRYFCYIVAFPPSIPFHAELPPFRVAIASNNVDHKRRFHCCWSCSWLHDRVWVPYSLGVRHCHRIIRHQLTRFQGHKADETQPQPVEKRVHLHDMGRDCSQPSDRCPRMALSTRRVGSNVRIDQKPVLLA